MKRKNTRRRIAREELRGKGKERSDVREQPGSERRRKGRIRHKRLKEKLRRKKGVRRENTRRTRAREELRGEGKRE